jgi:hypothetical protein
VDNDTTKRLLVYDNSFYYEIDLVTLNFRTEERVVKPGAKKNSAMPFNINLFPKNITFEIPIFKEEVYNISFIANMETLNLKEFPFDALIKCFNSTSYVPYVKEFAQYYFRKLKSLNQEDTVYGPISPLFIAIYHNNMGLLEHLLDHYCYPYQTKEYWSPLIFAFINNYNSAVKVICDQLIRRTYLVSFSQMEFRYLLNSPFSYCHKLMATIPSEPLLQNFPRLLYINQAVQLHYVKEVGHLLFSLKTQEYKLLDKFLKKKKKKKIIPNLISKKPLAQDTITKSEIISFQIPFKYSYTAGTPDSVNFLDTYSQSNTEEFILSEWKEVIIDKWGHHRIIHVFLAVLYWLFTIIATLSVVFFNQSILFEYISLGCIFFFVLLEIIQMISYSAFKVKRYFEDAWNYIDWMSFFVLIIYFIFYHNEKVESDANKVLGCVGLIMMFYRSFSYLRIINSFTTLIGMINTIIQKLVIFFLILIYFFIGSGILILKLNPNAGPILNMGNAYVWTFFGGIEGDDFLKFDYAGIAMIFGTVMVTIILLNILIAFLSNLFSRLEDKQKSNDLKEKASMILDLEIIVHFFKYVFTGKRAAYYQYAKNKEQFYERLIDPSNELNIVILYVYF